MRIYIKTNIGAELIGSGWNLLNFILIRFETPKLISFLKRSLQKEEEAEEEEEEEEQQQ